MQASKPVISKIGKGLAAVRVVRRAPNCVGSAVVSEANEQDAYPGWPIIPQWMEIPPIFHSVQHEGPFRRCVICQCDLLSPSSQYMIEKVVRGSEAIVEYAMCLACQAETAGQMSADSTERIQQLLMSVDHESRTQRLIGHLKDADFDAWLRECLVSGIPRLECHGYQIMARCAGGDMELGLAPLMISDNVAKQFASLLSEQTRKQMDDFLDLFGMPPEFTSNPEWTPFFV